MKTYRKLDVYFKIEIYIWCVYRRNLKWRNKRFENLFSLYCILLGFPENSPKTSSGTEL